MEPLAVFSVLFVSNVQTNVPMIPGVRNPSMWQVMGVRTFGRIRCGE
jgi:hypothetical protein